MHLPLFEITGTIWGSRTFNYDKSAYFLDERNSLLGQINYANNVHSSNRNSSNLCLIDGTVSKVTKNFMDSLTAKVAKGQYLSLKEVKKTDLVEKVSSI